MLGKTPRSSFSPQDQHDLEKMADEASLEIRKWAEQSRQDKKARLARRRKDYKRQVSARHHPNGGHSGLDTVDEIPTPPLTPDLAKTSEDDDGDGSDATGPVEGGGGQEQPQRRPSLAESAGSAKSLDLKTTTTTPAFPKRRGRDGVVARPVAAALLPEEIQSVIDLSTQLVAESIEMEWSYVVAIDLARAAAYDRNRDDLDAESPLRFVSVHGMPIPAPLLSVAAHVETLTTRHNALLYVNEDNGEFFGVAGEFSTGLLVKVGQSADGETGYVLGTFTEDQRRVLNQEDLLFVRSFARDINRHLQPK